MKAETEIEKAKATAELIKTHERAGTGAVEDALRTANLYYEGKWLTP